MGLGLFVIQIVGLGFSNSGIGTHLKKWVWDFQINSAANREQSL